MKRFTLVIGILLIVSWGLFYSVFTESKVLTTLDALKYTEEYLKSPPPEWENSTSFDGFVGFSENYTGDIEAVLTGRNERMTKWLNKRQWEVTVRENGWSITVVLDAHTAELLDIYGPSN